MKFWALLGIMFFGPAISMVLPSRKGRSIVKPLHAEVNADNFPPVSSQARFGDKVPSRKQVISAGALVAGTTVGAGILALPNIAHAPGFGPSSLILTMAWVFMSTTGLYLAEVSCNLHRLRPSQKTPGILAMIKDTLGTGGATFGGATYVFIHYALLVAYIAGAGEIISDTFDLKPFMGPVAFSTALGGIFLTGSDKLLELVNNVFVAVVVASFAALVAMGVPLVQITNLQEVDFGSVMQAVPIMLLALVYHNIVPTICAMLNQCRPSITSAILGGSFIPLCMFLIWNFIILGIGSGGGSGDFDAMNALRTTGSDNFAPVVGVFSEAAIVTSFIGFVIGLTDFFADLLSQGTDPTASTPTAGDPIDNNINSSDDGDDSSSDVDLAGAESESGRVSRWLYLPVLLPPTAVAIADPAVFAPALDLAGAFGISVLFGAVPAAMAFKTR